MSMSINTDERLRRIELDDGDGYETVYVVSSRAHSAYHGSRDCEHVRRSETLVVLPRERAQRRTHFPCQHCVLGDTEPYRDKDPFRHVRTLLDADPDDTGDKNAD